MFVESVKKKTKYLILSLIIFCFLFSIMPKSIYSMQKTKIILDFVNKSKFGRWMVVNDGVMGGISRSNFSFHPEGYLIFEGKVLTDFGGGFASIRSNYENWNIGNYQGLILKIKGDGKTYQFRCRMGNDYYQVAYRNYMQSKKNEWNEVRLPFSEFVPTYRGRILKGLPSLDSKEIRWFGIMISDKQVGEFHLKIDWIGVY